MKKRAIILGCGGFIGCNLCERLKSLGYFVRGVDIKYNEYRKSYTDEFIIIDLRNPKSVDSVIDNTFDEVYQLAADMGGAEFIFTGENNADILHNNALININICNTCVKKGIKKVFYSSSACVYSSHNQMNPENPNCEELSTYPANPDSEYGWEKLFSERLYLSFMRNKGLDVRIARFHNIFGEFSHFCGGREKAPAAICRKVIEAKDGTSIEIFGDGKQTRSFLYIDECLDGIMKLMNSDFSGPVNIGSDEMISINDLVKMVCEIAGKNLNIIHVDGPLGVRGRNSDNRLIKEKLGWAPSRPLREGMQKLYEWIKSQME